MSGFGNVNLPSIVGFIDHNEYHSLDRVSGERESNATKRPEFTLPINVINQTIWAKL